MSQYYIIDGYNFLHAIPSLQQLVDQNLPRARQELETLIEVYCSSGNIEATIVYDSRTIPDFFDHYVNFQQPTIVFAGSGKTADDFIITEAEKHPSKDTTVISNDKVILDNASRFGCKTKSPELFYDFLLKKIGRSGTNPKKYRDDVLGKNEIQEWINIFKNKKD